MTVRIDRRVAIIALAAAAVSFAAGPRAQPATKPALRIMPLGDSITFGTPNPAYGGYRHALGALLERDRIAFHFVGSQRSGVGSIPDPENEGHPGWTIMQIKNGIDANDWLEISEPDLILLHIGTNDIRLNLTAAAPGHLAALLDDILMRQPRAHVIVAQIIPSRLGADEAHHSYNIAIPGIVAAKGPRISMVDMRGILRPAHYADGLHPNPAGYDKMARVWEAGIRKSENR
jgi:hypothetical protein